MAQTTVAREVVSGGLTALPGLNARVTVTPVFADGSGLPSVTDIPTRVEDVNLRVTDRRSAAAELVVAQPVFPGDVHGESVGARYLVRWLTERGMHEVSARYLGRELVGPALIGWRLGVSGPVTRIQRRAHARVAVAVPVLLEPAAPPDGVDVDGGRVPVAGTTVDVSEGGLFAAVPAPAGPAAAPRSVVPAVGAAVVVRFELAGERFDLAGRVVRHQAMPDPQARGVAVAFDPPNRHGDRLRPLLFAHQLNARRVGVL